MFRSTRNREDEVDITPSGQSPTKKLRYTRKNPKINAMEELKSPNRPYRPRTIQSKYGSPRKNTTIVQTVFFNAPAKNSAFPKRLLNSPKKFHSKSITRSKSCVTDNLSLFDIENIERMQQLIPYRLAVVNNIKYISSRHSSLPNSNHDSVVGIGILRETGSMHTDYKKHVKQS